MTEHDLRDVAFPKLDESQMAALGRCPLTVLKRYRDGGKLFEAGARDFNFFIVKSGTVEIVDESGDTPKIIAVHGPGEFTGDASQTTGSPALFSGVARGQARSLRGVARCPATDFDNHPDLGISYSCLSLVRFGMHPRSPERSRGCA